MKKKFLTAILTMPLAVSSAYAEDAASPATASIFSFSGFGTGALTRSSTDKVEFSRPNQATVNTTSWKPGIDSNLGLQVTAKFSPTISATAQGLIRKNATDEFHGELAWAFAKAKVSEDFNVRLGRIGLPVFMISDYRNLGYANTLIRPPAEAYSQVPIDSVDGADVVFQRSFNDTTLTAQLALGKTSVDVNTGPISTVKLDAKSVVALNLVLENGPFTVRFGRSEAKLTVHSISLNQLLATLKATGAGYGFPQLSPLADDLALNGKKSSFTSLGLGLDWKDIVVQSEYTKRKSPSYLSNTTAWYLMGGYRIGKFLPYFNHSTVSRDHSVPNTIPAACSSPAYGPACTPTLQALSAAVDYLVTTGPAGGEQSTNSLGVRWDFSKSAALKVQVDRVTPKRGLGVLYPASSGYQGSFTVFAVGVDFVF